VPILTPAQLQAAIINPDVAKEAYAQVEKRLSDLLETKKSFETRAASMLSSFITLALALTGVGASIITTHLIDTVPKVLPFLFFVPAIPLIYAAWRLLEVLLPTHYGNLGTSPDIWLEQGCIDAADNVVPDMQAYMLHHMANRINTTQRSNDVKAKDIVDAANWATSAPIILCLGFLGLALWRLCH
jgi:hypothetical protein